MCLIVHDKVLCSWIEVLNIIRNMAAHHGRLWNRTMGIRPKIPQKDSAWHSPVEIDFLMIQVISHCVCKRGAKFAFWRGVSDTSRQFGGCDFNSLKK